MTNAFTGPVTLTAVDVRSDSGASVLSVTGAALAAVTEGNFIQRPVDPPAQVPVSGQVSVQIDVQVPRGTRLPRQLTHVIGWRVPGNAPALALLDGETTGQITGLPLGVSKTKPEVLASPLKGDGWMSLQGCCRPNGHRSLRVPVDGTHEIKSEMFAVDWVQLKDGAYFTGDGSSNNDYPYIGTDLLAVANGTVVRTRDGMPNETPGEPPKYVKKGDDYIGNSVVIKISANRYAVYGHMLSGSITVKVGDRVRTGDIVGKLGNSGNSTAAHLHFVVIDRPDFLTGTSMPFVINKWTLQGNAVIPDEPGKIPVYGPSAPQNRTHPLYLSVGAFGGLGLTRPNESGFRHVALRFGSSVHEVCTPLTHCVAVAPGRSPRATKPRRRPRPADRRADHARDLWIPAEHVHPAEADHPGAVPPQHVVDLVTRPGRRVFHSSWSRPPSTARTRRSSFPTPSSATGDNPSARCTMSPPDQPGSTRFQPAHSTRA